MQQIRANWSDIEGRVRSVRASDALPGFHVLSVDVARVAPVSSFANLLEDAAGQTVDVNVRDETLGEQPVPPGAAVRLRVRRAPLDRTFAHDDHVTIVAPDDTDRGSPGA